MTSTAPRTDPLRLGIVGAGAWCRGAHLPALAADPGVELAAVASAREERAADAAREFGIRRVHRAWPELLADDLDAVLVTAPAALHAEIAQAAFERGLHVFCEAPLAMTSAEGRAMLAAAEHSGRRHGYALPRPFVYGGEAVGDLLASGAIGEPRTATLSLRGNAWLLADPRREWRARADAVPPLLVGVAVGVLGELFGDVGRVVARLERLAPAPGDGAVAPAPDYFAALLEFRSGLRATVDAGVSPAPVPGAGLAVFGSEGMIVWDWTKPGALRLTRPGAEPEDRSVPVPAALAEQVPFSRRFVAALREGTAPSPDFRSGLRELLVIEACVASAAAGAWTDVPADVH